MGIEGVQERLPMGEPGDGYPSSCVFLGGGHLFEVGEAVHPLAHYLDRSVDASPRPAGPSPSSGVGSG